MQFLKNQKSICTAMVILLIAVNSVIGQNATVSSPKNRTI